MHFLRPKGYVLAMPDYIPKKLELVYLSGITEFLAGLMLLFPSLRSYGALSIIIMLLLFFSVHIHMLTPNYTTRIPRWVLWLRIPLQFFFIYWAYLYL